MTMREFLRLNLTSLQRRTLHRQCPVLVADIEDKRVRDQDFAIRLLHKDDEAMWLLWFCLHSSFFVRIVRMRSKHECGDPCNLADFNEMPCRWSTTVLGEFFGEVTREGAGQLEAFCVESDERQLGLMDWLAIRLHEDFHLKLLNANGFGALEEQQLPDALKQLFVRDARFRTIFMNRWLYGLTEIEDMEEAVRPPLPPETLRKWIAWVDEALLSSPELDRLVAVLESQKRLRERSGVPPRTGSGRKA